MHTDWLTDVAAFVADVAAFVTKKIAIPIPEQYQIQCEDCVKIIGWFHKIESIFNNQVYFNQIRKQNVQVLTDEWICFNPGTIFRALTISKD